MDPKKNQELGVGASQKSNLLLAVGMLVAGLLVGGLICGVYFSRKLDQAKNKGAEQVAEALKNSAAPGAPNISGGIIIPDKIFNIWGIVEKIDGNTLTVNAFFFGEKKTYKVTVGSDTKISKREMLQNFSQPEEGKPFNPFKDSDGNLSDIREKDAITAEASDNIKDKIEFEAKIITLFIMNTPRCSCSTD